MWRHTAIALVTGLVWAIANLLPGPAWSQDGSARPAVENVAAKPIGKVVTAAGSVIIERKGAVVVQVNAPGQGDHAKVGDVVYLGDVVRTGDDGRVGINFTDGTSFNLSTKARMVLDEYVFDPNGKSNSTLFSLTRGTFTFVAGSIAKTGDMKVDTPVATLGIRGTTPHIEISDDGATKFSTLIEESKGKLLKKSASATAPRPDQPVNRKLNVCRGC